MTEGKHNGRFSNGVPDVSIYVLQAHTAATIHTSTLNTRKLVAHNEELRLLTFRIEFLQTRCNCHSPELCPMSMHLNSETPNK